MKKASSYKIRFNEAKTVKAVNAVLDAIDANKGTARDSVARGVNERD